MRRSILKNLDVAPILHPDDKSTIENLNKIPGFKAFVDKTIANVMEKYAAVEFSGEGINITEESMPAVYRQLKEACKILDVQEIPACSTEWFYEIGHFSVGEKSKRMILQSGTIDLLSPDEMLFVMGHELGHMKCGHKTYHMLTEAIYMQIVGSGVEVWTNLIRLPLLKWYRMSDYTADRMGLLCCQDLNTALSTMIKMAGLPKSCYGKIDVNSFIQQAKDFTKNHSGMLDSVIKYLSINAASMPWLVIRAAELLQWYESGEYDRIVNQYKLQK